MAQLFLVGRIRQSDGHLEDAMNSKKFLDQILRLFSSKAVPPNKSGKSLALPEGIRCAMRDGTWPRGRIPAARFRHRLGVTWDVDLELIQSEKAILEDSSDIAQLQTLVSCCGDEFFRVHKGSTISGRSELPWLDVERAVVIGGGADIGDDRWLVLDYRISREAPRILVNTVEREPPRFAGVVLADSITDFLALAEKK